MKQFLGLYHRMPGALRSVAATARGYYLRSWRYGRESDSLIAATLERESWSPAQWERWRDERLGYVLDRALKQVPWYREHWAERRRRGDRASPELLENWPVLEKETLRSDARAFVADDIDIRRMFHEHTSGTTGKPLDIWRSRHTVRSLYALASARTRIWDGIPDGVRYARLGGQLVTPVSQRTPPFWVWNAAMHQLYMSTYHLAPDLIPHYFDALHRYRIEYIAGYTSALVALAREALRLGRDDLRMLTAVTNAEPVREDERKLISEAFHCPVRETYGMAETVAAGSECPAGTLHQWPEAGHIEVSEPFADSNGGHAGPSGEFLCTGLLNPDMPLIRYRVGDRGTAPHFRPCACGRTLPVIDAVDGRTTDLLLTRDGRRVFWLNPVFYGLPVRETQIVQESLDRLTVRAVPAPGFGPATTRTISDRLRQRMGDVDIDVQQVSEVPRTSFGKLRAVVCNLSAEEQRSALSGEFTTSGKAVG
jgi:phenylacetate-CoA ligase